MSFASLLARMSDLFGGVPLSNRNYIVDPFFESWMVSSIGISGAAYTYHGAAVFCDMAGLGGVATIGYTALGNAASLANAPWMTSPVRYAYSWNQTTGHTGTVVGNNAALLGQNIEDVRTLSGKSSTFSCSFYNGGASSFTISNICQRQYYGTGGSPSAQVATDKAVNWIVKPGWNRLSVRLDWPVAGGTLGTNNNHMIQIGVWLPQGTFNFLTTQWQLEQSNPGSSSDINGNGGAPTACEFRGLQAELARVQRYYRVTSGVVLGNGGGAFGGGMTNIFGPMMRATPATTATNINTGGGYSGAVATGSLASDESYVYPSTAITLGTWFSFQLTADARL